jgi:hypothetical protein
VKDGDDFCGVPWITEPADGFLCLVGTRRTLDVNGHCCDYARCSATVEVRGGAIDRCLLAPDHKGFDHHGSRCYRWRDTPMPDKVLVNG